MRVLASLALFSAILLRGQTIATVADKLDQPFGLGLGPDGALYFTEVGNHRISRLDLKSGTVTTVADGLKEPYELAFDKAGDLYFCDRLGHNIGRIYRKSGRVTTVAGTGTEGYAGDGGRALDAQFRQPHSIAFAPDGKLLICDILNFRIRSLDLKTGIVNTWAGTGVTGKAGDEAPIAGTPLAGPRALAIGRNGVYYLALREGNSIYRLDPATGRMSRFAGTGEKGYSGDGGSARDAKLSGPKGVALGPDGSLYIADTENHAIRRVDPKGIISTIAGNGERGPLARPHGVFVDSRGVVYVGDSENNRILTITSSASR